MFDKTFTGENGRNGKVSTGMGLYICKMLCDKLGHRISISSVKDKYTCVAIAFGKNVAETTLQKCKVVVMFVDGRRTSQGLYYWQKEKCFRRSY